MPKCPPWPLVFPLNEPMTESPNIKIINGQGQTQLTREYINIVGNIKFKLLLVSSPDCLLEHGGLKMKSPVEQVKGWLHLSGAQDGDSR